MLIKHVRRRRVTGPLWIQYEMEVLVRLLARYRALKSKGVRAFGGRYPPAPYYSH